MKPSTITRRFLDFNHYLSEQGFIVGIDQMTDGMRVIGEHDTLDMHLTKLTLRGLYCGNPTQWQQFDRLFDDYWFNSSTSMQTIEPNKPKTQLFQQNNGQTAGLAGSSTDHFADMASTTNSAGAGRQNTIGKADFRFLKDSRAMQDIARLTEQLALSLKRKPSRRVIHTNQGRHINIKQTLRHNMKYGGELLSPRFIKRLKQPYELVVLHDVSHSMTWNNPLLFRFVRGLVRNLPRTEAFVFHTQLHRVTDLYREKSIKTMQQKLEARNNLWLGGTCIAESMHEFNQQFARRYLSSRSLLIIISDGFDTDAPVYLASELKKLRRQCRKILWLNPMIGREHYDADSDTFIHAKPHIDSLLAANSLDSLRKVIHTIAQ